MNQILSLLIHLHGFLMIKIVHDIYGKIVIIIHWYVISFMCRMNKSKIHFFLCVNKIDSTVITCILNYFCWMFVKMKSIQSCDFDPFFSLLLTLYYACITFFKATSVLNGLSFWTLLWGKLIYSNDLINLHSYVRKW